MNEGDYAIWREDLEQTWKMDEDSEILTLRWSEKDLGMPPSIPV